MATLRRIVVGRVEHAAAAQDVVEHDQPAGAQEPQALLVVVGVLGLVGVDEGEVERLVVRQPAQRLQRRPEPQVDPVGDAGLLEVAPGDLRSTRRSASQATSSPSSGRPRAMQIAE